MPVLCVLPARLGSTRLVDKPLALLGGEPLIVRVYGRVRALGIADAIVVATDAQPIADAVARVGGRAVMTSSHHQSGTDRVAEVVSRPEFARYDIILNVQGDEPFLQAGAAAGAVARVQGGDPIGTAAAPLDLDRAADPARVKVVTTAEGRALYFSRAPIPYPGDPAAARDGLYWQHVGVYAYRRDALAGWAALPPVELERTEMLEQLRPLAHGMTIGVARLDQPAEPGIDTADDLAQANLRWPDFATGVR